MKIEILVPDSLNEITLGQYQKFLRVEQSNEQFVAQKMLEIFCGVKLTEAMSMRIKDVRAIINHLDELLNQQPQLVRKFSLKGQEYGFIPNLEDMSFGEYIDLDTFLGDWKNMHKAMSVLYRPIKDKYGERYNIVDYDVVDAEHLRDMPLDAVISSLLFFLPFRDRLIQTYDQLFRAGGGESYSAVSQFGEKWGWYQSIYQLAQGDIRRFEHITELNIHQCLTLLSFEKERSEIEAQELKKKYR